MTSCSVFSCCHKEYSLTVLNGAFSNNPTVVARAARNVIEEYKYTFKTLEFAVYCSPRDEKNYTIFEETITQQDVE